MMRVALISPMLLMACDTGETAASGPSNLEYQGAEATPLDDELVQIDVTLAGSRRPEDVISYARCAVAQYTLNRGYGFARHLRTKMNEEGGVWTADAVYTISPTLPRGLETIDAKVVVSDCEENGIPTV
ncbi:hypothetical protein ACXYMO_12435 [Arenibacterium sp. CAU 1754]